MDFIISMLPVWLEPSNLLTYGGLTLLLLVVFAENGLLFGFFLPGDSLLFTAGLLSGSVYLPVTVVPLIGTLILAAAGGSWLGYWFGRKFGSWIKSLPDGRIYKKKYLQMTAEYYENKGPYAFILGRFLPIIRTFVPVLAGIVNMPQKRFMALNISGVCIWVISLVSAGYLLGKTFPQMIHHLEWVILSLLILPLLPVVKSWYHRNIVRQ